MDQQKTGAFLRMLRKSKNLTQEQLAEQLHVAGRTVSRWETGSNMPDISILIELADFYDVDIREIINGERKSENMDKEIKDTLVKVAEYTDEYAAAEKSRLLNRLFALHGFGFVLFLAIYLCILFGSTVMQKYTLYFVLLGLLLTGTAAAVFLYVRSSMQKKRFRRLLLRTATCALAVLLGTVFTVFHSYRQGSTSSAVVVLGSSERYTKEELEQCADIVMQKFRTDFEGCMLTRLSYDEEISKQFAPHDGKDNIVLFSDFTVRAAQFTDGTLGATGTNTSDWQWHLTRGTDGNWRLVTYGYG